MPFPHSLQNLDSNTTLTHGSLFVKELPQFEFGFLHCLTAFAFYLHCSTFVRTFGSNSCMLPDEILAKFGLLSKRINSLPLKKWKLLASNKGLPYSFILFFLHVKCWLLTDIHEKPFLKTYTLLFRNIVLNNQNPSSSTCSYHCPDTKANLLTVRTLCIAQKVDGFIVKLFKYKYCQSELPTRIHILLSFIDSKIWIFFLWIELLLNVLSWSTLQQPLGDLLLLPFVLFLEIVAHHLFLRFSFP